MSGPIDFLVSNDGDNGVTSALGVRNVNMAAGPESTRLSLMIAGLGLLGVVARRRQA